MMKKLFASAFAAALMSSVFAQGGVGMARPADDMQSQSGGVDTSRAKPAMPKVDHLPDTVYDLNGAAANSQNQGKPGGAKGEAPKGAAPALKPVQTQTSDAEDREFAQAVVALAGEDGELEAPQAIGSTRYSMQYSSSRTYPPAIDSVYPMATVGKLYFQKPDNTNWICSAAVIKRGMIVTAGHCVHSGNGARSGWYKNFTFIPGYRRYTGADGFTYENVPYGRWSNWTYVRTTSEWYVGRGTVPSVGDIAVITYNPNTVGSYLGDYTGYMGYSYPFFIGKQVKALGYPANLDRGLQAHAVDAMAGAYGAYNNGVFGSDMTGGSSGGPVVLNMRQAYTNSTLPVALEDQGNSIVSVISWGYTAYSHKVQGGTQFSSEFDRQLMTPTCTVMPRACSPLVAPRRLR